LFFFDGLEADAFVSAKDGKFPAEWKIEDEHSLCMKREKGDIQSN